MARLDFRVQIRSFDGLINFNKALLEIRLARIWNGQGHPIYDDVFMCRAHVGCVETHVQFCDDWLVHLRSSLGVAQQEFDHLKGAAWEKFLEWAHFCFWRAFYFFLLIRVFCCRIRHFFWFVFNWLNFDYGIVTCSLQILGDFFI